MFHYFESLYQNFIQFVLTFNEPFLIIALRANEINLNTRQVNIFQQDICIEKILAKL